MGFLSSLLPRQLVGLDIGVSGIKAVEISGKKDKRLMAYNRIPLPMDTMSPEGEIRNRHNLVEALSRLFAGKNFSSKKVAIGAFGNSIMTKKISVPKMTASEFSNQLYFEAEQYIPFNVNEVNMDFAILGNSTNTSATTPMMDVLLIAAKKDYIGQLRSAVEEAGLSVEVVDSQAFALGNVFEFNYGRQLRQSPTGMANVIVDFGAGGTKLSVVEKDRTTFTRELRQSGISCTNAIAERLGVSFNEAEQRKISDYETKEVAQVIHDFCGALAEEVGRTLDFFLSQSSDKTIEGVFTCGGASQLYGLSEALEKKVPAPVKLLNPIQSIAGSGRKMNAGVIEELKYLGAVAIGLSLRTTGDTH